MVALDNGGFVPRPSLITKITLLHSLKMVSPKYLAQVRKFDISKKIGPGRFGWFTKWPAPHVNIFRTSTYKYLWPFNVFNKTKYQQYSTIEWIEDPIMPYILNDKPQILRGI